MLCIIFTTQEKNRVEAFIMWCFKAFFVFNFFPSVFHGTGVLATRNSWKELDDLINAKHLFSSLPNRIGRNFNSEENSTLSPVYWIEKHLEDKNVIRKLHKNYLRQYQPNHTNLTFDPKKLQSFKDRVIAIAKHNAMAKAGVYNYEMGINQFTDSDIGVKEQSIGTSSRRRAPKAISPVPWFNFHHQKKYHEEHFDWRDYNAVSPVKDQGRCGSCVFFSSTAALESHNYLVHKASGLLSNSHPWGPLDLSEQELLDCAKNYTGYRGCINNHATTALEYIKDHGLSLERDYSYNGRINEHCYSQWYREKVSFLSYHLVHPLHDEIKMKQIVREFGPIVTGIYISEELKMYKQGIYDTPCVDQHGIKDNIFINHMLVIVGYGTERINGEDVDYWIAKNSYSRSWGEHGFVKMRRNKNLCLLGSESYYLHTSPYKLK